MRVGRESDRTVWTRPTKIKDRHRSSESRYSAHFEILRDSKNCSGRTVLRNVLHRLSFLLRKHLRRLDYYYVPSKISTLEPEKIKKKTTITVVKKEILLRNKARLNCPREISIRIRSSALTLPSMPVPDHYSCLRIRTLSK